MSDESLFRLRQSPDRFGRWQEDHPVKRLQGIGGVVGRTRIIDTVYKIEYMTDEIEAEDDRAFLRQVEAYSDWFWMIEDKTLNPETNRVKQD